MKTKLLLFTFLTTSISFAQITANFEAATGNSFSSTNCQYVDTDTSPMHTLVNSSNTCGPVVVTESSTATTLGYSITIDTTTPNGPVGLTEGDFFGVATSSAASSQLGAAPPQGSQAFLMEDVDGDISMNFTLVDLAGTTNPQFSMQYILDETGWETADFFKVSINFTDCASSPLVLIDTTTGTGDIDDLGIENSWNTLNADLTSYISCKAQLVIEFSSNSASEELGIDNISFSAGMTLSATSPNLDNAISVFPNPSNGNITIKNSGTALNNITVTDVNGRLITTKNLTGITSDVNLDLRSKLSSGLYFMTITNNNSSIVKKLIIE